MPELPDIEVYIDALRQRIVNRTLQRVTIKSPFLLRTAEPPVQVCEGQIVRTVRRLGKRIVIGLSNELWMVLHLMIAGRLHWRDAQTRGRVRPPLLAFEFDNGMLTLTEAGTKRRASLHIVRGEAGLADHDRRGLEVLEVSLDALIARRNERNHTLKRALTDPTIVSGIGNAYSDEILHHAQLSPLAQTRHLDHEEWKRLYRAAQSVLREWTERLRSAAQDAFPEGVTAFREGMAVHGRFGKPCPACGTAVQRIRYADNDTNYCPRCQTEGKLLADRALSRLLKADWPQTIEELENRRK